MARYMILETVSDDFSLLVLSKYFLLFLTL
jgi:hypothetical protein